MAWARGSDVCLHHRNVLRKAKHSPCMWFSEKECQWVKGTERSQLTGVFEDITTL